MSTPQLTPPSHRKGGGTTLRSDQNTRVVTKKELNIRHSCASLLCAHYILQSFCLAAKPPGYRSLLWCEAGLVHAVRSWHLKALRSSLQRVMTSRGAVDWQLQCTSYTKQELSWTNTTTSPSLFLSGDMLGSRSSTRNECHALLTRSRLPRDNEISWMHKGVICQYASSWLCCACFPPNI